MSKVLLIVLILALLGGGGYYFYSKRATIYPTSNYVTTPTYTNPAVTTTPEKVTVTLNAQNNSGEKGTATLEETGGKVKVTLSLTGAPAGVTQPAHIHTGTCATIGGVLYPLTFPMDGTSETTLNVTMAQLKEQMPLALNVHKSQAEASVYYSCGDLPL
jgi:hypothetical protein